MKILYEDMYGDQKNFNDIKSLINYNKVLII